MIEHETSSDNNLLAIEIETKQSSSTNCGRGLRECGLELDKKQTSSTNCGCGVEECQRKHGANADSIKTVTIGLSQQKERSIRKALWKKIKSEQQIMSINSSNRKLLRSLIADELLNTKLHFTKESCSGKKTTHRRDNEDNDNCNNEYKNGDNKSSPNNIEYVVDYIKTNSKDDSLFCNNSCGSSSNTSRHEFDQQKEEKAENLSSGIISANIKAEGEDDTDVGSELEDEKFPPLKAKLCTPENFVSVNDIKIESRTYNGTQILKVGDKISGKTTDGSPASYGGPKITDNYIEEENELSEKVLDGNLSVTMQHKQCTDESSVNKLLNHENEQYDTTNMKNETLISNCSKANEEYLRYVNSSKLIDNNGNENNVNRQHNSPSRSCDDTTATHNTAFKYLNTLKQQRENEHYPENENYANANIEETPSINGMEKYSVDDGCRNAIGNDCSEHIMVNLLNAPGDDFFTYKQPAINSDGFSIVNQLSAKNTRNEYSDASNKINNVNWGNDDNYIEGETHTRKNKAESELTSSVNQIKQQESIFVREQQQHQSRNEPKEDAPQNSVSSYHSYLEHGAEFTNSSKPDNMEKQRKFYTSAINVARREHEMYHFNKDLYQKQQSHNDKEAMQNASAFANMENFEEPHYIQQQKRQKYSPFDKQQQQQLQQLGSHNQAHVQQFDQEHFQQQQNVNSSYNLHNFFHSQMQSEIQQSLLQQEQHNNQQHQSNLMAYLHQGSRQQQQLQEAYHERHQYHQRMHHGSHLSPSPHPNNNQHQQQMDKLQSTSISTNNKSIQISTIDELMTDEYHEDHNAEFKLALSPTNAMKHENQDDGYETSAGDVLTPNSHTSSTHSLTPQHQMQHTSNLLPPTKCGDQHFKSHQIQFPISNDGIHSQQLEAPHNIIMRTEMNQDMISENAASSAVVDPYSFINDELNAVANVRKLNEVEQNSSARIYLELPGGGSKLSTEEVLQQQQPSAINSSPQQDFSDNNILHSNNNNNALTTLIYNKTDEKMKEECCVSISMPSQKRRGRKKKVIVPENTSEGIANALTGTLYQQLNPTEEEMTRGIIKTKERKKHDRFNGLPENEVAKRILPDHLCDNLDIVIVGINPGLFAAYKGHHYAGPGNHFWKCLYLSGLTHEQMGADEDYKLIKYGIGFTNMVQRATKGSADLTRKEIKEGSRILLEKLQRFRPKIAVFNGKLIFEVFSGKKDFNFGRQAECVDGTDTYIWVMPSSSARCAQLPRAADKVPFYAALKKFRDYLNGIIPHIEESECVFTDQKFRQGCEENLKRLAPDSGNSSLQDQNGSLLYDTAKNILESQNAKLIDTEGHARGSSLLEESSCVNTSIQQQHCNSQQHQLHAYMYVEENVTAPRMSKHALDRNPCHVTNTKDNRYILANCHTLHPPQKKKRGRPKKIKEEIGQELIAPATGNKILVSGQMQARGNDFSNILNLSMMAGTGGAELPKKKRGRPKKIKILTSMTQSSIQDRQQLLVEKCNSMSVQEVTTENVSSPKQHMSFSTTQQPNSQQVIFATSSPPMRSPALNCSFTTGTSPPRQLTPSIQVDEQLCNSRHIAKLETSILGSTQQLHVRSSDSYYTEKLLHSSDASSVASSPHTSQLQQQHINSATSANLPSNDSHLEESSVPNSPNICAVDFQPSKTTGSSDNLDRDMIKNQMPLSQRFHEHSSRYSSPTHEPSAGDQHTTNEHFNQWLSPNHAQRPVSPHDYNHNQLHLQETQQVMPYHDQQNLHHLHQQQTPYNSSFASHWQRIQQQQCYEPNTVSYLMCHTIQQHINTPDVHTYQQHLPGDVTSKSLSGLESLVDQIPTISATDTAVSNSLSATAAAAVETRLQSMLYNSSRNLRNSNSGICETSEMYAENVSSNTTNNPKNDNTDLLTSDSRGRNTPLTTNSIYDSGSPGNYNIHRLNSSTPESLLVPHVSLRSPHCQPQTQQLLGSHHQQQHYALLGADRVMDLLPPSKPATIMNNSSPKAASKSTPPLSSSISASDAGLGPSYGCNSSKNTPSNIHTSNFSVSHLAASSLTPPSSIANTNHNYPSSPTNYTVYNRSNLTAAVAPASSANSSSNGNVNLTSAITNTHHMPALPQMYMDPHAHLSVPVNTVYSHPHTHAHHHGYTCGRPPQHSPIVDYDTTPYGSPSAAVTAVQSSSQNSPVHTLHMPSPNYPYGYATPPTQSSYTSAMHAQSTPPPSGAASSAAAAAVMAGYHHVQHHHHHHGHHTTHHLSMFERPKPSDIGSYCGF